MSFGSIAASIWSISYHRFSPTNCVHEVIGKSEVHTVRLPGESFSELRHTYQLLLKIKWILESLGLVLKSDDVNQINTLDKPSLIRIILYILKLSTCKERPQESQLDYLVLRRIALDALVAAVRLVDLQTVILTLEEGDWVQTQLEDLVLNWDARLKLSSKERLLLEEIIPTAICNQKDSTIMVPDLPLDESEGIAAFKSLTEGSHSANGVFSFWTAYDLAIHLIAQVSTVPSALPETLRLFRNALDLLRSPSANGDTLPLATYLLENMSIGIGIIRPLSSLEEVFDNKQLANRLRRVIRAEMSIFQHDAMAWADKDRGVEQHIKPAPSTSTLVASECDNVSVAAAGHNPNPQPIDKIANARFRNEHSLSPTASNQGSITKPTRASPDSSYNAQHLCVADSNSTLSETEPLPLPRNRASVDLAPIHNAHSQLSTTIGPHMPSQVQFQSENLQHNSHTQHNQTTHEPLTTATGGLMVAPADAGLMHVSGPYLSQPEIVGASGDLEVIHHKKRSKSDIETRSMADLSFLSLTRHRQVFRRFRKPRDLPVEPLPDSLEFNFSNCSEHIVLWCKRHISEVVRITFPFHEGQKFRLRMPEPFSLIPNKEYVRSVRFLVASQNAIIAVCHIDKTRWLYHAMDEEFCPLVMLADSVPHILAFAISQDGSLVAAGCGNFVLLYKLEDNSLHGPWRLEPAIDLQGRTPRIQKLSFSVDATKLISAIQVEHRGHKHAVYVSIWTKLGPEAELEAQLDPVHFTMGYGDDLGISTVSFIGDATDSYTPQVFLTAAMSKSYPSIIYPSAYIPPKSLDIPDKRIDNVSQSIVPSSSHIFAIRSGRNKICFADIRTRSVQNVADYTSERQNLYLKDGNVAIGLRGTEEIWALWRDEKQDLVLKRSVLVTGKWTTTTTSTVGAIYRSIVSMP